MLAFHRVVSSTFWNNWQPLLSGSFSAQDAVLLYTSKRFRYHADRERILKRAYGYNDKSSWRGRLPRTLSGVPLPMPPYTPVNSWSERRALFGQNDYIDILGNDLNVQPIQLQHHIPGWLKGFQGNEYQMLLRKRAFLGHKIQASRPTEWHRLKKRLRYLYRFLNYNTKDFMDKKVLRR